MKEISKKQVEAVSGGFINRFPTGVTLGSGMGSGAVRTWQNGQPIINWLNSAKIK